MDISSLLNYGIGILGILIGILVSYYFYRRSIHRKEPYFAYRTDREIEKLSGGREPKIQILYRGTEVDRVSTTYLWIWNGGSEPIKDTDIPETAPLKITIEDGGNLVRVLDYQVLKTSREPIRFTSALVDDNIIGLTFKFLDSTDGGVIGIQHTGSYDSVARIHGVVLGAPFGFSLNQKLQPSAPWKGAPSWFVLIYILGAVVCLIGIFTFPVIMPDSSNLRTAVSITTVVIVALILIGILILVRDTYRSSISPIPKQLAYGARPK